MAITYFTASYMCISVRNPEPTTWIWIKTDPQCLQTKMYPKNFSFWRYKVYTRIFAMFPGEGCQMCLDILTPYAPVRFFCGPCLALFHRLFFLFGLINECPCDNFCSFTANFKLWPPPHRRSPASAICWPWPARLFASQTVNIRRTRVLLCRTFSLERSSWLLKNDTLSLSTFRRQLKHFYFSLY